MRDITGVVVLGVIIWAVWSIFFSTDYSKAWWDGQEYQTVCSDYSINQCYSFVVLAEDGVVREISLPNGGYVYGDGSCYKGPDGYEYDRLCKLSDQSGKTWDIIHYK